MQIVISQPGGCPSQKRTKRVFLLRTAQNRTTGYNAFSRIIYNSVPADPSKPNPKFWNHGRHRTTPLLWEIHMIMSRGNNRVIRRTFSHRGITLNDFGLRSRPGKLMTNGSGGRFRGRRTRQAVFPGPPPRLSEGWPFLPEITPFAQSSITADERYRLQIAPHGHSDLYLNLTMQARRFLRGLGGLTQPSMDIFPTLKCRSPKRKLLSFRAARDQVPSEQRGFISKKIPWRKLKIKGREASKFRGPEETLKTLNTTETGGQTIKYVETELVLSQSNNYILQWHSSGVLAYSRTSQSAFTLETWEI